MVTKNYKIKPGQNELFQIVTNGLYRFVGENSEGVGCTGWLNTRIVSKVPKPDYMIHMDTCGDEFLFNCDEHGKVWVESRTNSGFLTLIEDATSSIEKSNLN